MRALARGLLALACATAATTALAQAYPTRPIRLVVGFAPAGVADTVARAYAEHLGRALGQPVVIENRAGAGSSIAAENVAKSAPDGYSVLIASPASISVNPAINPHLGYKPADLAPVTKVSSSPLLVVVNPASGIRTLAELVTAARRAPGTFNYATSGVGSAPHFGALLFSQVAGVDMVHVPFKGGAPAVLSVLAGDVQVTFATPPSVLPNVKAGRLRALAVTSRERSALMPEIPGMAEAGYPDFALGFWYGFFVPAGTPEDVVRTLFNATLSASREPQVREALAREGTEISVSRSPQDFAAFLAEDAKVWTRLAKESGAKAE